MPTRYLKPGICDSDRINRLSAEAEVFFYRLLVTVDDFGRTDARSLVLKAKCFPIKESATAKKVDSLLQELSECDLLTVYRVGDGIYLQLHRWDNTPRAKESKFPEMQSSCIHLHTDANDPHTVLPLTETVTETQTDATLSGFALFWDAYPNKVSKQDALKAYKKLRPDEQLLAKILAALEMARLSDKWRKNGGEFIPYPASWLNGRRWEDEITAKPSAPGLLWAQGAI